MPTAHELSIDGDMVLVAQARLINDPDAIIAIVDVGDLPRFAAAQQWSDIHP